MSEVSTYGPTAKGVKSINLKEEDYVINGLLIDNQKSNSHAMIVTQRGAIKKMNLSDFDVISRAKRGLLVLRELKANPHRVALLINVDSSDDELSIYTSNNKAFTFKAADYSVSDRYSNGSFILEEETDGQPIAFKRDDIIFTEPEVK